MVFGYELSTMTAKGMEVSSDSLSTVQRRCEIITKTCKDRSTENERERERGRERESTLFFVTTYHYYQLDCQQPSAYRTKHLTFNFNRVQSVFPFSIPHSYVMHMNRINPNFFSRS